MRRAIFFSAVVLMTLGTAASDRALAFTLPTPQVRVGSSILKASYGYTCLRWWEWRGALWVRSCWPAGYDPCWNAPGCGAPTADRPYWHGWGWTYGHLPW
jgi:hypothetical protein